MPIDYFEFKEGGNDPVLDRTINVLILHRKMGQATLLLLIVMH